VIGLRVWLRTSDGEPCLAGAIRVADPDPRRGGLLRGEFRYEGAYLDSPNAFVLDPIHLPLESRVFDSARPQAGVHACFEHSLPDDWGRGLLIRRAGLARDRQTPPHLLAVLGGDGLGALAYTTHSDAPPEPEVPGATPELEDLYPRSPCSWTRYPRCPARGPCPAPAGQAAWPRTALPD